MVLVGFRSVLFETDSDPDSGFGSKFFLYRFGSRKMIRVPQIRICHTGVEDPYFFARSGSELFSSDSGSGSERGPVQNQI